jgi:hypothetical protein
MVAYPANNTTYGADWSGAITGTASSNSGAGTSILSVAVAVEDTTTGLWWDGSSSSFDLSSQTFAAATYAGGSWSYGLAAAKLTSGHNYAVVAQATDSVGNTGTSSTVNYTYNTTAPAVSSINRASGSTNPTNTGPLTWTVTFSEPVNNVTSSNFGLTTTGTGGTAPSISSVSASGGAPSATWTVSASTSGTTGTNGATIGLNLTSKTGVTDAAGNQLGTTSFTGQTFTYDSVAPTVSTVIGQSSGATVNGFIKQNTGYYVYANVADNSGTGVQGVTANVANVTSGQTAVSLVAGSYTAPGGGSYNYRSALLTSNATQANGLVNYTVNATDNVGNASAYSNNGSVTFDSTAPVNNLSLSGQTGGGSDLSGTTVYYQGSTAGSFTITNALTGSGSGPASSSFPALGGTTTGWTHTASTVGTPTGGPYVSTTFSWTASTTVSPTEVVTGTDNVGNTVTTTLTFTNDSVAPSGGSVTYANGYNTTGSVSVAFTNGTDSGSGVNASATQLLRAPASLSGGTCGTFGSFTDIGSAGPTSPYTDSTVASGNCYQYKYLVPDNVGNTATYTSSNVVKVDTGAPTLSVASSGANVYAGGTTVYYRATGTPSGSFTVTLTDGPSGIGSETFATITGWTKGSVTTTSTTAAVTYTITSLATGGSETVSATNGAGTAASGLGFTLTADTTAPSGGSVTYTNGYNTTGSVPVSFTNGTDAGSGVNTATTQLLRASATLSGGTCGTFGSFTNIGSASPTSPYTDTTITSGNCYQYEYQVSDKVSNTATYTSVNVVEVDTTAPVLTITSSGTNVYYPGSGTTVYFKSGGSGSFTITGSDAESGISSTNFPNAPTGWTKTTGTNSATYTLGTASVSSSLTGVSATNNAGTTTSETVTITLDSTAPSGGSVTYANGYNNTGSVPVSFTNGTDAGSGVNTTATQLLRASATLSGGTCGTFGSFAQVGTTGLASPYADTTVTSGKCYEYEYQVPDNVGNTTTYTSSNVVEVDTAPPTVSVTFPANSGNYSATSWASGGTSPCGSASTICGQATDATSGITGASSISLTITQSSTNNTWNGAAFASGTHTVNPSSYNSGTGLWTYGFASSNFPAIGTYTVAVTATDAAGNTSAASTNSFTYSTISFVEQVVAPGGANLTTQTLSLPSGTTTGDTLILMVGDDHSNSATVSSVSGGGVGTWTKVTEQNGSSGQGEAEIWYGLVTSGSSTGITVTLSGPTNWQLANVSEWSGIASSNPVDASTSSAGTGTSFTAGPITTTQSGDLVISDAWTSFNSPGFTSPQNSTTSGYTALNETQAGGSYYRAWAAYQIDFSTGPISAGWTGPGSGYYATAIAAFKP